MNIVEEYLKLVNVSLLEKIQTIIDLRNNGIIDIREARGYLFDDEQKNK